MSAGEPNDDTIRVKRPAAAAPARHGAWPWAAAAVALAAASALGAWSLADGRTEAPAPPVATAPAPAEPAVAPAAFAVPPLRAPEPAAEAPAPLPDPVLAPVQIGDEAAILAARSDGISVFRLQPAPEVLVLVFPGLHAQGLMLNRVAALVEKAGLPHDRVTSEAALDEAIVRSHATADTYYSGHDYRTADIRRFFELARAQGMTLRPEEEWLKALLDREQSGAVVSLSQDLDPAARATILRHELSHGLYFTSPAYAAFVRRFWERTLTEEERSHFRAFLAADDYDTADEDLMRNETQAYLIHTADKRFFNARAVEMSEARLARLRAEFVRDMPAGWLRDRTPMAPVAAVTPASARPARPRRRQGRMSSGRARAVTVPPRCRADSIAPCKADK